MLAVAFGLIFQSLAIAFATVVLLIACGLTWRRDMPPIVPFCLTFQWIGAVGGTMFYRTFDYFPGGGETQGLETMIWMSSLGFIGLALGVRIGFIFFAKAFKRVLSCPLPDYDPRRLLYLLFVLYFMNYLFDVAPKSIWFGGAQIIGNILEMRIIPLFVLALVVFRNARGYKYLWIGGLFVVLPQFLTGFSDFKEILFVFLLILIFQWRPWSNAPGQRNKNARVIVLAMIGASAILWFGLIWSGGVKSQWRMVVWNSEATSSPVDQLGQFLSIASNVALKLDIEYAAEQLSQRLASGSLFWSYVLNRVPSVESHENGNLLLRAIENATVPRFLFPDKPILGGDSWLVRKYAGIYVAGDESGASIGLGYMPEFYIDFGLVGVLALCFGYGLGMACCLRVFATVSSDSAIFIGLSFSLLTAFFMTFDASFIKILAGAIQRTVIMSFVLLLVYPPLSRWLVKRRTPRTPFMQEHGFDTTIHSAGKP